MRVNIHILQITNFPSHELYYAEMDKDDTIQSLMAAIHARFGIPYDRQLLRLGDLQLEPGFTLRHYNVSEGDTMTVSILVPGPSTVTVRQACRLFQWSVRYG
jgi:hypothetical protein